MLAEEGTVGGDDGRSNLADQLLSLHHTIALGESFDTVKEKREAGADEDDVEFLFVVHSYLPTTILRSLRWLQ